MATIYRQGTNWRAQVCVQNVRDSGVFPTRAEATQWAQQREGELCGRKLPDRRFLDALRTYGREEAPSHRGSRWELVRLRSLERDPLARRKVAGLTGDDFARWRDDRLKAVKPATVARELNLIRSVFEHVRRPPHRWVRDNPLKDVKWPSLPAGRRRRISPEEVKQIRLAFGVGKKYQADTQTRRVGLAFLFALETAMRSGEICGLDWRDVHLAHAYAVLPATKNGERREVSLSTSALAILRALPSKEGNVFGLTDALRDALWRKNRPAALRELHFHDSRAEAIWRLSKKLDVLQLCQMIGHKDLNSLRHYYRESASEMAKRLG